jgi:MFS family permease
MPGRQSDSVVDAGGGYARYVLFVLVLVYVFNFVDRQVLSILAEEIKHDLGISDAQIGFLYGTAFAVFYAVFGIPLGKLADVWVRTRLISVGLAFWSVMTALSGTARSFATLAACRFGVGVGEASATPAAFSVLADYFPPRLRATALALYSSGVYIGAGIGVFLGGVIVDAWRDAYPDAALAPFGLKPWQAAFFAVGLPGLLMALWVATLREPRRGVSEGLVEGAPEPHPFLVAGRELLAVLPPFTLLTAARNGRRALLTNSTMALAIAIVVTVLVELVGTPTQWIALGVGAYAALSWAQNLVAQDPVAFTMIFRCATLRCVALGFPSIAFVTYGVGFWAPPFMLRVHGVEASTAGTILGLSAAVGGLLGVSFGGWLSDRLRAVSVNARLWIGIGAPLCALPIGIVFLTTDRLIVAYAASFLFSVVSPMWLGPGAGTVNDLVMPRMRAMTSAFYLLMVSFIGLALGPYSIGRLSDHFASTGLASAEALRHAMLWSLGMLLVAAAVLAVGLRYLPADERSRLERARAAGEAV